MKIKGAVENSLPEPPDSLKPVIFQHLACNLSVLERMYAAIAFEKFESYTKSHPLSPEAVCDIVYINSDNIELELDESDGQEMSVHLIFVRMNHVREDMLNDNRTSVNWPEFVFLLLEELLHTLYQIRNEYRVKQIAKEIALLAYPNLKLNNIFPFLFDEDDQPVYHPDYASDFAELSQ